MEERDGLDFYDYMGLTWLIGTVTLFILYAVHIINPLRLEIGTIGMAVVAFATTLYVFEAEWLEEES